MSDLSNLIDSALLKRERESPARDYLGGSTWGEPCARKLAFGWHGVPTDKTDKFPPRILRIFEMGHDSEPRVAEHLRLAGFKLLTETADGEQFGFTALGGKLKGHCDGIIVSGPLDLPYPIVWENKAVGAGIWKAVTKDGLKVGKPVYYGQIQTYCAYIELPDGQVLNGGLFTMINRETGEIHDEFVPFDGVKAQDLSDRAVAVVESGKPEDLPRISDRADWWECSFCDYRKHCHGIKELEVNKKPEVSAFPVWMTKGK